MNELTILEKPFEKVGIGKIRVALLNNNPMFNLYDSCFYLGYTRESKNKLYLRKDRIINICESLDIKGLTVGDNFELINLDTDFENTWITEQNFYDLCLESHAKNARPFRRWVTSDVLPCIRKDGAYISEKANPEMLRQKADEIESLSIANEAAKMLLPVFDEIGLKPQYKALALKQIYRRGGIDLPIDEMKAEKSLYDLQSIAKEVGVYSSNNKPHKQVIGYIISQINIQDDEKEIVSFENNGHMGTTTQYTKSVIDKVKQWIYDNNNPTEITVKQNGKSKRFTIVYKEVA